MYIFCNVLFNNYVLRLNYIYKNNLKQFNMKKITLLMSLLITSIGFSQAIPVTFESGITNGAKSGDVLTPADANWFSDSGLASVDVEDLASDTPDKGNAGKMVSSAAGNAWQNAQLLLNDNYIDLTTNKTITLDVYSDSAQDFLLKLEKSLGTGADVEKNFAHTGTGWETIAVDFSTLATPPNDQYRLIIIFPCWSTNFVTAPFDSTTYVDNITGDVGDAYVPPIPPVDPTTNAPTPPARAAEDVFSVYSDTYANVSGANYNLNWGQTGFNNANTAYNPTGNTSNVNTVLAYTNFNYQGMEFQATDLSDMENLHFDVYSNTTGAKLKVSPVNNGTGSAEVLVEVDLIYNGWSSVNVPITAFTGMTWDGVFQLKFDGQSGTKPSNIYVDNIYFWKAPTVVLTDASLTDLTVNGSTVTGFSSTTLSYDIELPFGTTAVPTIEGTPTQTTASAVTTDATQLPGKSTVVVTAQDGSTQLTYTINFTVSTGLSKYCDKEVTHFLIPGETASAINLTIENTGTTTMKLTVSHADISFLQLEPGATGSPTLSTADDSVPGEISILLTWAAENVPTGDVSFGPILWSKTTFGGNWMLNAGTIDSPFTESCAAAGVEDFSANSIKMYPNPANGVVGFSTATNEALEVSVYDLLGKLVIPVQTIQSQLNISSLNPGMYFVNMRQGTNASTQKLLVN